MPLSPGESAPWFTAPTPAIPQFVFETAAGRYVLMVFLPPDAERRGPALKALATHMALFDDAKLCAFVVVRDEETWAGAGDLRGLRWIDDREGAVSRRYAALDAEGVAHPHWLVLDPTLRALGSAPLAEHEAVLRYLRMLPAVADHAATPLHAPVLIAPRILEPELCQALIALHADGSARFTGVMRDEGSRTVAVMDDLKKRRDVLITDPDLKAAVLDRLERRLYPMIERALAFRITHIERYVVACYDVEDGGVFRAHRDDTTHGTAHRKFACSLNLSDDYDGGDLRFPEFGPATYRPPAGGAAGFSCSLMHEATKVTRGRRYAFLPFFYDEAGAQVLADYETRVAALEPAS